MIVKLILFLSLVLTITFGAHIVLYRTLVNCFDIENWTLKSFLLFSLTFLALSFMASFFLLRWKENGLTVGFYVFAATWTGMLVNLLLAAGLTWLSIVTLRIAGYHPNARTIAAFWLIMAVLYSAYGVWNASQPRIKKMDVAIENLPDYWKNKVIVQLSDVHLGHIQGLRFLNRLVKKVNAVQPELVLITGDLFDGMDTDLSAFADPLDRIKARQGIFFVTGNHETYIGLSRVFSVLKKTNIRVLQNELVQINGLQILGISYPGIQELGDIKGLQKATSNFSKDSPCILMFHTPTNFLRNDQKDTSADRHFATYWFPDTSFDLPKQLGVDLQLSGHTHRGQIFPFGYLTNLIYRGFDYGRHRLGGFSIYITSGAGTWGPPMRTGNSPEIVVIRLTGSGRFST
jgi:predicted MPP superfamily phosphohydrolase